MDSGNLSIIDFEGNPVKLPSDKKFINVEFFFLNNNFIKDMGK